MLICLRHMMSTHVWASSAFVFIIVWVWHLYPLDFFFIRLKINSLNHFNRISATTTGTNGTTASVLLVPVVGAVILDSPMGTMGSPGEMMYLDIESDVSITCKKNRYNFRWHWAGKESGNDLKRNSLLESHCLLDCDREQNVFTM